MGAFVIPRGLHILPVLLLLFVSYSSGAEVVTIDVYKAKALLNSGYTYIDVRTEEEFKNGHVDAKKILNIPYMFNTSEGRVKNPDFVKQVLSACGKYAHLVVGCQTGSRSINATTDLVNAGFKHVFNMDGGYAAWMENGFPVKKPYGTEVVTIDIYKAKALLDSGYGYLDVRTKKEFKNGHMNVTNIKNIPYMFSTPEGMVKNPNYVKQVLSAYDKNAHLVVGCEIGLRSVNATADLINAGFKHVFNMGGGYSAWVKNGFPVKKSSGKEVVTIDIYKAKNFLNVAYAYIDVRTEEEIKNGHLDVKNITYIPYLLNTPEGFIKNPDFVKQVLSVYNKYNHLVVGCEIGVRSINATADLVNAGFKHVLNMGGGYAAWVKKGLPVKKSGAVVTLETYKAKNFLAAIYGYLDVRTKEEFKNGHVDVKNILNIPYRFNTSEGMVKNSRFVKQVLSACGKYAHIVVGCQTGSRSINATTDLVNAGFNHVFNMNGGYAAWVKYGFPVKKP